MANENPFVYGEIVPRAAFIDRDVELDRLIEDLADGQKVFLISPRRYGKSSLIRQVRPARLGRRRIATVDVTVSSFQLVRRLPRRIRARPRLARDAHRAGDQLAPRSVSRRHP